MNILVIGGGGREHALAWKAAQSEQADKVYVAPGNAGTEREPGLENVAIKADDCEALAEFAQSHDIGLTIVGPEVPLVAGVVDLFRAKNLPIFGPTQAAAQLEGSKRFSKDFLARHQIPTAAYQSFTQIDEATNYIDQQSFPLVIKADGLAAGKGVIIAESRQQAIDAVTDMLAGNAFGEAGHQVVIEEFLHGEEASFIVMVDGEHILPLASSQDHKARDDGDKGPNTGGMGAYSPAPVVTEAMHQQIMDEVIQPTVKGMAAEGNVYTGFLYAGIMIAPDGTPKVLEFNCRFGDPETQPIMFRLRSDLVALCLAALHGKLHEIEAEWDKRASVGVVLAAGGYPGSYQSGDVITGLESINSADQKVFHAGTQSSGNEVTTAGGRVLCVVALGDNVTQAQARAYEAVKLIRWDNMYYRKDIGYRAIAREQE